LHSPPKIKSPTKHHPPGGGHHKSHPHHHQHHHHHLKHHGKQDGETASPSSQQSTDGTTASTSTSEHEKSQEENETKKESSSTGKNKTILRTLQPTSPPKFLLAYVPKVKSGVAIYAVSLDNEFSSLSKKTLSKVIKNLTKNQAFGL
jgi:hypothetical protein